MIALLAHQGGWDELLLTAGLVLAMLGLSRVRRRAAKRSIEPPPPPTPAPGPPRGKDGCAYCGAALAPDEAICPECGFRTGQAVG